MKLENQLKACPAINRISLITHFYGPCSSSHLFITVLCLAGILMRPTDRKTVKQQRTSNLPRSWGVSMASVLCCFGRVQLSATPWTV